MFHPVLVQFESKHEDIKVLQIDIDDEQNEEIVSNYYIQSIPTVIYFTNGSEKKRSLGFKPIEELEKLIK